MKGDNPILSIVSPVRNERNNIFRSLESVKSQTLIEIEHIIVDGNSIDGTLQASKLYAEDTHYPVKLLEGVEGGVYNALNTGIREAEGKYVAILHGSDSFTTPHVLEQAVELLESSGADLLYADLHYVNERGKIVRRYSAKRFAPNLLLDGFMPPHPTVIVRRSIFDKVGYYSLDYPIAGDYDWLCRALLTHKVSNVYLPVESVEMAVGGISSKWSSRLWKNNRDKYKSLKANGFNVKPLRLLRRYRYL